MVVWASLPKIVRCDKNKNVTPSFLFMAEVAPPAPPHGNACVAVMMDGVCLLCFIGELAVMMISIVMMMMWTCDPIFAVRRVTKAADGRRSDGSLVEWL